MKDLQSAVNKLDPALRRVAFIGWPSSVTAEKRIEFMTSFMNTKCTGFKAIDMGHDFPGPYNNRVLSTASWIEFSSKDNATLMHHPNKLLHAYIIIKFTSLPFNSSGFIQCTLTLIIDRRA